MKQRNAASFVLGIYSLVLAALTLGKSQLVIGHLWKRSAQRVRRLELIPFENFFYIHKPWYSPIVDTFANVALFVPFGMLLAMVLGKAPGTTKRVVLASLCVSLGIEVSQYLWRLGVTDINDLMLNTLGGYIGARVFHVSRGLRTVAVTLILVLSIVTLGLLGAGPDIDIFALG